VSNKLAKRYQEACINEARGIYNASSKQEAILVFKEWKKNWQKIKPEAVECLERDLDELLSFYDCPKSHWIKIRTTNVIERSFREVRRRTRVFSCFSNKESCNRLIYAIVTHLNNKWKEHPLKEFTQFS
jgi:putative transposase